MNREDITIGAKVHYLPKYGKPENGIVKALPGDPRLVHAWVVYQCNNEWDRYADYTGAATSLADLRQGWAQRVRDFLVYTIEEPGEGWFYRVDYYDPWGEPHFWSVGDEFPGTNGRIQKT
jgi:hypothetical protein